MIYMALNRNYNWNKIEIETLSLNFQDLRDRKVTYRSMLIRRRYICIWLQRIVFLGTDLITYVL